MICLQKKEHYYKKGGFIESLLCDGIKSRKIDQTENN